LNPSALASVLFWGLYVGCVYVSLAVGLNVIFGVMRVVNFAHGEVMVLGAYVTFWAWRLLGLNPYVAIPLSMLVVAALGVAIQRLCFRPISGSGKLNEIFISLGLATLLQNAMCRLWTDSPRRVVSPYEAQAVPLGAFNLRLDYIIGIGLTALTLSALHIFLKKTYVGLGLRATSQNREAAVLVGIDVERMEALSFGLGCSLAALSGSLLSLSPFSPYSGSIPAIKAFAVVILGGPGSISGAVIAGLAMGMAEALGTYVLGGSWRDAVVFLLLTALLMVRPWGLRGEVEG